jgi:hypothetical protein
MCSLLYNHSRRRNRTVSEALTSGTWIGNITHDLTLELLNEYFKLWRAIEAEHVDLDDATDDLIVWTLESSGEYMARSAYIIQFEGQIKSNFPKLIWKAWATPRCKFSLWLLLQDRLRTSQRLLLRGCKNNYFVLYVKEI